MDFSWKVSIYSILFKLSFNSRLRIAIAKKMGMKIGKSCIMHSCIIGSEPYLINIGNHCEITSNVEFITHDGATWIFRERKAFQGTKYGPIIIHDNCMIGIRSIILPGVEIGPDSIVGAGSVVTKNIPPNSVYAGNPARFIGTAEDYLKRCNQKNTGAVDPRRKKEILTEKFQDKLS